MAAVPIEQEGLVDSDEFTRFYRRHLPTVYGYALRLCNGDRSHAEDLTQEAWFALVRELNRNHPDRADIRWLLTVVRSRFLDGVRRKRLSASKLGLVRPDVEIVEDPTRREVLALLDGVQPLHRAVLMMRYVDDLPVPAIAAEIGRDVTATHSLLARARAELRRHRSDVTS